MTRRFEVVDRWASVASELRPKSTAVNPRYLVWDNDTGDYVDEFSTKAIAVATARDLNRDNLPTKEPPNEDQNVTFAEPTRVIVEASLDVIVEQDLDTFDGEQYDAIDDVIRIAVDRGDVRFVTVRTIKRPTRDELTIPLAAIESITY